MSDAQRPDQPAAEPAAIPATDVDGNPIPSPEVLAEQALPAIYKRSPRLVRVLTTAGFAGFLFGFVAGLFLPSTFGWGRFMVGVIFGLGFALAGTLLAGMWLSADDERLARRAHRAKQDAIEKWVAENPENPIPGDKE